jgi:hypothetical protein
MFAGARINGISGNPMQSEWNPEEFAHHLTLIDYLLFRRLKPDVYIQINYKPGLVEGGGYNVELNLLMETFLWFQMVMIILI